MTAYFATLAPAPSLGWARRAVNFVNAARALYRRERGRIREEVASVSGLCALLMKSRNGARWTRAERAELRARLRSVGRLSLYAFALAAPGTEITLPLLAWWLDRRSARRGALRPAIVR